MDDVKRMEFFTKHRMYLIKDPLIKIMGNEKFEALKRSRVYKFIVEAFTMNVFSLVITTPNEMLIAGMDFGEYIRTRAAALIINTFTGRPYGIWRDWLMGKLRINEKSSMGKKYIGDTLSFIGFQLPIYWLSLMFGGAELNEMIRACGILTIIAGLTGRPYGVWLDKFRNECGLSSMEDSDKYQGAKYKVAGLTVDKGSAK